VRLKIGSFEARRVWHIPILVGIEYVGKVKKPRPSSFFIDLAVGVDRPPVTILVKYLGYNGRAVEHVAYRGEFVLPETKNVRVDLTRMFFGWGINMFIVEAYRLPMPYECTITLEITPRWSV